jgi:hypothetical protein
MKKDIVVTEWGGSAASKANRRGGVGGDNKTAT